jgi:capsular exopolysaccharide synthesis family protein
MSRLYEASQRASRGSEPHVASPDSPAVPGPDATQLFPREKRVRPAARPEAAAPPAAPTKGIGLVAQPIIPRKDSLITSDNPDTLKLITAGSWQPSVNEYRQLAATLLQANADKPVLTLLVASAVPGEGKTLTAANLALTLADAYGRRVLLVDADMRRPALHSLLGVANAAGLGDCLKVGQLLPSTTIVIGRGLTLLAAGQPDRDPVGQLSSARFKEFLDDASKTFDCVIFDTPPAALLPDAELIASTVHTVLLVVQAGKTPYQAVHRAIASLGRERIAGVVLNRVAHHSGPSSEYSAYYNPGEGASDA